MRIADLRSASRFATVAAAMLLMTAGCASKEAKSTAPPVVQPPLASAPAAPPPPRDVSEPQTRASLPPEQPIPEGAAPEPGPPLPPLPERAPRSEPSRGSVQAPPQPLPRPTPPPTEPERNQAPPAPILSAMLTDAQKREYNRIINNNVVQAKKNLEVLSGRTLNEDQKTAVKRIRAFLRQTEDAQQDDLALARSLSERARLLADDLVKNSP